MEQKRPITIGIDASRAFVKDPAGPEYYSWHLIKNLAEIDHKNRYVLYLRPKQRPNFSLPQNFKVKIIYPTRFWTQLGLAWETIIDPPDILFIPAHTLPLITRAVFGIGAKVKLLPQLPILVTIHGLEGKFLPQSGNFLSHIHRNWSISWSVRFANHLIAVSNDTLKEVLNTYNIHRNSIEVVHEGVEFEKYHNAPLNRKQLNNKYHIGENYILFVGTLQPRKNLIRLIKAFAVYFNESRKNQSLNLTKNLNGSRAIYDSKNNRKNLKLVIAGKRGWLYDEILKAPKKFNIINSVIFTGRIDNNDLPGLYKGAQAFILPSLTEGFGLPVLEAQAAGVPVVCSDKGALREVADNAAIFINPLKTSEITRAIKRVLEDKTLVSILVDKGLKNAKTKSWTRTAHNTLKIIERIVI